MIRPLRHSALPRGGGYYTFPFRGAGKENNRYDISTAFVKHNAFLVLCHSERAAVIWRDKES